MEVLVLCFTLIAIVYCDLRLRLRELRSEQSRDMHYMDWHMRSLEERKADRLEDSFD